MMAKVVGTTMIGGTISPPRMRSKGRESSLEHDSEGTGKSWQMPAKRVETMRNVTRYATCDTTRELSAPYPSLPVPTYRLLTQPELPNEVVTLINVPHSSVPVSSFTTVSSAGEAESPAEMGARMKREWNVRAPQIRTGDRTPLPTSLRFAVIQRDRFQCQWCDNRKPLEVDHIIPWSAGGSDEPTNLRTLCRDCNQRRSNRTADMATATALDIVTDCHECLGTTTSRWTREAFCVRCDRRTVSDQVAFWRDMTWEQWRSEYRAYSRYAAMHFASKDGAW